MLSSTLIDLCEVASNVSSRSEAPSLLGFCRLPLHINLRLQRLQPIEDRAVFLPGCP
jgi:hypothetical protein